MSYEFQISRGILRKDGEFVSAVWAGQPPYKNDPSATYIHNKGPLPVGTYYIGKAGPHPDLGKVVMFLTPAGGNTMFDRSGFFIHGANLTNPEFSSEGCIIAPRAVRDQIATDPDKVLQVIA